MFVDRNLEAIEGRRAVDKAHGAAHQESVRNPDVQPERHEFLLDTPKLRHHVFRREFRRSPPQSLAQQSRASVTATQKSSRRVPFKQGSSSGRKRLCSDFPTPGDPASPWALIRCARRRPTSLLLSPLRGCTPEYAIPSAPAAETPCKPCRASGTPYPLITVVTYYVTKRTSDTVRGTHSILGQRNVLRYQNAGRADMLVTQSVTKTARIQAVSSRPCCRHASQHTSTKVLSASGQAVRAWRYSFRRCFGTPKMRASFTFSPRFRRNGRVCLTSSFQTGVPGPGRNVCPGRGLESGRFR
jgi:hypothetical protein